MVLVPEAFRSRGPSAAEGEVAVQASLRAGPTAPREARRAIEPLRLPLGEEAFHDAALLVTELVTNAVRHAGIRNGDPITLTVRLPKGGLLVEVRDRGRGFEPRRGHPGRLGESGWGLFLVDRIADRWGVDRSDDALAWFELRLPPTVRSSSPEAS